MGFPSGSDCKESTLNVEDLGSIPGLGRSPGEGNSNLLQYSCLESSMDGGASQAIVHGIAKNWTQLEQLHWWTCVMEHFFEYLPAICISSLLRCLFRSLAHFKTEFFVLLLSFKNSLYALEDSTLSAMSFTNIFSQLVACVLVLDRVFHQKF